MSSNFKVLKSSERQQSCSAALVSSSYWHMNHFSICCRFWLEWPSSTRSHRHTRTNMQAGVQDCGVGVCPGTRLGCLGIDSTVIWIAHPEETGVRTGQRWLISSDWTLKIWTRGLFHVKTDSFCDENKKNTWLGWLEIYLGVSVYLEYSSLCLSIFWGAYKAQWGHQFHAFCGLNREVVTHWPSTYL